MENKLIERINELSRKSRKTELTCDEKEEQQRLRQEYLKRFRANFIQILDNIEIVDEKVDN